VSLKRAVEGTFHDDQNDCSPLETGGAGGSFLAGTLTVKWTTLPGTPSVAQKTTTIAYSALGRSWDSAFGGGTHLELTINVGSSTAPTVTGGFTGGDAGVQSHLSTVISQSYGSVLLSPACSTGGVYKLTFGLGSFSLA
jgi:hypothetical protein